MDLIRTIREKQQTKKQTEIQQNAEDISTLSDFDDCIYIAFRGVPMIPIEKTDTSQEILVKLNNLRQNYIHAKMRDDKMSRINSIF